MNQVREVFFSCPYCLQRISMILDTSQGGQSYIEDCEVCCRPIAITYTLDGEDIQVFTERSNGE